MSNLPYVGAEAFFALKMLQSFRRFFRHDAKARQGAGPENVSEGHIGGVAAVRDENGGCWGSKAAPYWPAAIGANGDSGTDHDLLISHAIIAQIFKIVVCPRISPEIMTAFRAPAPRLLLFCLASDTDWQAASIMHATAQHMMVRGLIERDQAASRYVLTDQGRAVLAALLAKAGR
jgi:hypothetical protein